MKKILLFFCPLLLLNCTTDESERILAWKEQYELITHIELPNNYKIISNDTSSSGSLVKKTIIELNRTDCIEFCKNNGFGPVNDSISPLLFGSSLMDSIYRLIPDRSKFLHKYGKRSASPKYFKYDTEKNTNWVYLLDTTTCKLYCLVSFADLNGYAK